MSPSWRARGWTHRRIWCVSWIAATHARMVDAACVWWRSATSGRGIRSWMRGWHGERVTGAKRAPDAHEERWMVGVPERQEVRAVLQRMPGGLAVLDGPHRHA